MELVCPICNGLSSYIIKCSNCHGAMEARGAIQEYFDDYSADLDRSITQKIDGAPHDQCVHLFYCPQCDHDHQVPIHQMYM